MFLTGLVAVGTLARAESRCADEFAQWVKTSQAQYQTQPKASSVGGEPARESCLPSEGVRKSLQRALGTVRRHCEGPDAGDDAATTKPLIEINADVLSAAPLCGQSTLSSGSAATEGASCLSLNQASNVYWLANTRCAGARVITVVEIRLAAGGIRCRGHVVTSQVKLGTTKPSINYECIENGKDCTAKSVREIFPYCSW